jgi:hypothetical protein
VDRGAGTSGKLNPAVNRTVDTGVSARAQELTQREFQRRQQHDIRERSRVEILADMTGLLRGA